MCISDHSLQGLVPRRNLHCTKVEITSADGKGMHQRLRLGVNLLGLLFSAAEDAVAKDDFAHPSRGLSLTDRLSVFVNIVAFAESLPSTDDEPAVILENAKLRGGPALFAMGEESSSSLRISIASNRQNEGFGILVANTNGEKRILLIQCKTQEAEGEEDNAFNATYLADTIRSCAKDADEFFEQGWTVSLLVLVTSKIANDVVSSCTMNATDSHHAKELYRRTAVMDRRSLYPLLGPSFALALDMAQGHFREQ